MKKVLSLILLLVMILSTLSFVACDQDQDEEEFVEGTFGSFDDIYTKNAYLGYGINIINASTISGEAVSMQYPIFDNAKLMKETLLKEKNTGSRFEYIQGETIEEFCLNMSNSNSVSSGKNVAAKGMIEGIGVGASVSFSNGLKTSFSTASSIVKSQYFMRVMAENKRYGLILQSSESRYKEMLDEDFEHALYNAPVEDLFHNYGTHLLTSVVMGGNIYMDYTMYSTDVTVTKDSYLQVVAEYQQNADVSFAGNGFSSGEEVSFENAFTYRTVASESNIKVEEEIYIVGGDSYGISNEKTFYEQYANWQKSLDDTPALIGLRDDKSLYPIWKLIDTSTNEGKQRQQELISYFQQYGQNAYNDLCDKYHISNADDVKLIYTLDQLKEIVNNPSGKYKLMNDIEIGGAWAPIDTFSGVLDGNGFSIYNFKIVEESKTGSASVGFVRKNIGTIKNLTIGRENSDWYLGNYAAGYSVKYAESSTKTAQSLHVGAIAGQNEGTIDNCKLVNIYINAEMADKNNEADAYLYLGGIAGRNTTYGKILNCQVDNCTIIGSMPAKTDSGDNNLGYLGGISSLNYNEIANCSVISCKLDLTVRGDGAFIDHPWPKDNEINYAYPVAVMGGIVAQHESGVTLSSCKSNDNRITIFATKGTYTIPTVVGGKLVGQLSQGALSNCTAESASITITTGTSTESTSETSDALIGKDNTSN